MGHGKSQNSGQRVQLHRALSKLGWGSRKQAWGWIEKGEVRVDGNVETNPLVWVDLGGQQITRLGEKHGRQVALALAFHKPRGVVTTRSDERGRQTVYDLLPADLPWLFPAGRLDADSEGLLIMTNDSQLAVRLTDPEQHLPKRYEITIRQCPDDAALARIRAGLMLADGPTRPARVRVLESGTSQTVVEMTLTEGRNRQARRMWAAVGHRVLRLKRVAIGSLPLGDLLPGTFRWLEDRDLQRLKIGRKHMND